MFIFWTKTWLENNFWVILVNLNFYVSLQPITNLIITPDRTPAEEFPAEVVSD